MTGSRIETKKPPAKGGLCCFQRCGKPRHCREQAKMCQYSRPGDHGSSHRMGMRCATGPRCRIRDMSSVWLHASDCRFGAGVFSFLKFYVSGLPWFVSWLGVSNGQKRELSMVTRVQILQRVPYIRVLLISGFFR